MHCVSCPQLLLSCSSNLEHVLSFGVGMWDIGENIKKLPVAAGVYYSGPVAYTTVAQYGYKNSLRKNKKTFRWRRRGHHHQNKMGKDKVRPQPNKQQTVKKTAA